MMVILFALINVAGLFLVLLPVVRGIFFICFFTHRVWLNQRMNIKIIGTKKAVNKLPFCV